MFKTHQGVTEDSSDEIYMRPETAQGILLTLRTFNVRCVKTAFRYRTNRQKFP